MTTYSVIVELNEGDSSLQYPGRGWRITNGYIEHFPVEDDRYSYMRAKVYDVTIPSSPILVDPQPAITWSVDNPALIQVDREDLSQGYSIVKAVALGAGSTTVHATYGVASGSLTLTTAPVPYYFFITDTNASITLPFVLHVPNGGTRHVTAGYGDAAGSPYTLPSYKGAVPNYTWTVTPPSSGLTVVGVSNQATISIRGDVSGSYTLRCDTTYSQSPIDTFFSNTVVVDLVPTTTAAPTTTVAPTTLAPTTVPPTTTTVPPITHVSSKLTIAEVQWDSRQPDELNYLRPVAFRFNIKNLPKVSYFVQSANIPTISLGTATQPTPFIDLPHPGDKFTHGELSIKFMVQEDLANYIELYNWIVALGFPDNRGQFRSYVESRGFDYRRPVRSEMPQLSDATLTILGSNNVAVASITYLECFPTSLSALDFDVSGGSAQYFYAVATFQYNMFIPDTETV
jgi:hypothetical protein